MSHFPRVWMADDDRWDSGQTELPGVLRAHGCHLVTDPGEADVLLTFAGGSLPATLADEAGVVIVVASPVDRDGAAHLSTLELAARAGVISTTDADSAGELVAADRVDRSAGLDPVSDGATGVGDDLLARVEIDRLTATATLALEAPATPLLRVRGTARNPGAVVAAASHTGARRVVVVAVELGRHTDQLLVNATCHVARRDTAPSHGDRSATADVPAWQRLKAAVTQLRLLQNPDGSVAGELESAGERVLTICESITELAPLFPHDADYLAALTKDFTRWADEGLGVPDFLDSLIAFHPERQRVDGREHLVVFPMYTQNGNQNRNVEAVIFQVIWPDFVADLEAGDYSNKLFVPIRFIDFTAGYDTNSAVLFPETVAMREVPRFTWGAIFADREAARFRAVVSAAAELCALALPPDAARLLASQELAEQTFVTWDLIHDRTHMHGDLPFDPFMIKQRMPYFLYTLEELRCDLTAFREAVKLEEQGQPYGRLVQYAILFDRIFRFPISGSRVRNYDGLGGQLLFAWLHQHHVLHWTDNRLSIDWPAVTAGVLALGRQIEELYWRSIDRPKTAHWLAAYQLVSGTLAPHPASAWATGALPLEGPPKGLTDAVLPDEFPLSMFYEALQRKLSPVIAATAGITG